MHDYSCRGNLCTEYAKVISKGPLAYQFFPYFHSGGLILEPAKNPSTGIYEPLRLQTLAKGNTVGIMNN